MCYIKPNTLSLRFPKLKLEKGDIHCSQNILTVELTCAQKIIHTLCHCLSEKPHLFMKVIEMVLAVTTNVTYHIHSNVLMLFNNHNNLGG